MQRIKILLSLQVAFFAMAMQAQTPAPKPDPELRKLHVLVGHWTYEGENKPGPLGPGGKVAGEYTSQMILGGFFLQGRYTEKGARFLEIDGYDSANKNLTFSVYGDDGSTFSGVLRVSGNTFTWTGKLVSAGKQYQLKESLVCAGDFMSGTQKGDISPDGKTWTPFFEAKYTKAKPAAKK